MPLSAHRDEAVALMDFTGEDLVIFRKKGAKKHSFVTVPFDIVLDQSCLGPKEERRFLQDAAASGLESDIELVRFHRIMCLLSGEDELMRLLWSGFFRANESAFSGWVRSSRLLMLVPTTWEPQVSTALLLGFIDTFGVRSLNVCTEAVAVLFSGLKTIGGDIPVWDASEKKRLRVRTTVSGRRPSRPYYDYEIARKDASLHARLLEWGDAMRFPPEVTPDKDIEMEAKEPKGRTFAAEGYFNLVDYLGKTDFPRVDMDMDVTLGMAMGETGFRPFVGPDDPVCQWYGRTFTFSGSARCVDVPLAAQLNKNDKNLFPLARLVIPNKANKACSRQSTVALRIRKVNHGKALAHLELKQGGDTTSLDAEFPLPRLYH